MKKRFASLLGLLLCCALLCSCSGASSTKEEDGEDGSQPVIGFTFDSFLIERWQRDRDVFVSTASELGVTVNVQNANGSVQEQRNHIDYFIQKDVDAIVVVAIDCYGLADSVAKARAAGIPVIAYDRPLMDSNADLYISFDNERVGEMMAQTLVNNVPPSSNILSICGSPTDQNVVEVKKGFDRVIANSSLNVAMLRYADNWFAETAYTNVNEAVESGIQFSGVHCGNDDLASQAFLALSEHRLAGSVCLVGQDADLAACQRIVEGTQTMTVYKPVDKLAKKAAENVVRLIAGESADTQETIFDGTYDIPYVKLEPIMVTKENIDSVIIDGGFHRREEVYLNVG